MTACVQLQPDFAHIGLLAIVEHSTILEHCSLSMKRKKPELCTHINNGV